jgi:hypothetical protein
MREQFFMKPLHLYWKTQEKWEELEVINERFQEDRRDRRCLSISLYGTEMITERGAWR